MRSIRKISDGAGNQGRALIGSVIFAAENPNPTSYVSDLGQLLLASSYPALAAAGWPTLTDLTASTAVGAEGIQRACRGANDNEAFLVGRGSAGFYRSTNAGASFVNTGMSYPSDAAVLGATFQPLLDSRIYGDILWDPVSSTYCVLIAVSGGDGVEALTSDVQLWSSPDLQTWTFRWNASGNFNAYYNGRYMDVMTMLRLVRDASGNCWLSTGNGPLYKKPAGEAINTGTGWTQVNPSGAAVASGTATRFQVLANGVLVWWQAGLSNGQFYTSSDGGATWVLRTKSGVSKAFSAAAFSGGRYAVLFANEMNGTQTGVIHMTTDFVTWTQVTIGGLSSFSSLFGDSAGMVIWHKASRTFYQSSTGYNWIAQVAPASPQDFDCLFRVGAYRYASTGGYSGPVYCHRFSGIPQHKTPNTGQMAETLLPFFKVK